MTHGICQQELLVSVIVPVYNSEKYLHYCVDSILDQSYKRIEVILVDDGSTDSSPIICDSYAMLDSRVTVVHQENGGIAKAQNTGLDKASGECIAFVDNDDILDRRNIELLLHAMLTTHSDMSKGRWSQFGISRIAEISSQASMGATAPRTITVFTHPFHAYQTIFSKFFRIIGDLCGQRTEARYFNEANWCRLYRREIWDGIRFPEGMYAQDVYIAGELYMRMRSVADINVNLYNWLQSPESVTHSKQSAAFYHDNVTAGIKNFSLALDNGITPARSFYTIMGAMKDERLASDHDANVDQKDQRRVHNLFKSLRISQVVACEISRAIRLIEKRIYDFSIKNMK